MLLAPVMDRSTKAPGLTVTLPLTVQLLLAEAVQVSEEGWSEPSGPERRVTVMPLAAVWVEKTARLVAVQPLGTQVRTEVLSLAALLTPLTEK